MEDNTNRAAIVRDLERMRRTYKDMIKTFCSLSQSISKVAEKTAKHIATNPLNDV